MISNEEIVRNFWQLMGEAKFEEVKSLIKPDISVWWPNTREVYRNSDQFVTVNKKYPGNWSLYIDKMYSMGDRLISVARVESRDDKSISFYATSFFTIENGLISEIIEYWSENCEPPAWRIQNQLSERY